MQQSCEFKGMSHFCCLIALLPVVPFIATGKNRKKWPEEENMALSIIFKNHRNGLGK
jgi:hypothetical protein